MVSSTRQAIAGLLVIFGVAVLAHAQTTPVKEPTATISGRITVKDKPVPGVAVGLRVSDPTHTQPVSHRAVTDANGEYRLTNVAAGTYVTSVVAPAFVYGDESGNQKSLIVGKGETIENLDFTLARGGVITGKVVDSEGRPLIEQHVQVIAEPNRYPGYYSHIETDDRGIYRAFAVPPGIYRVAAGSSNDASFTRYGAAFYKQTYHPNTSNPAHAKLIHVTEGSEATGVDIVLGRVVTTFTASGRIVDEAGQPVPNVPYAVSHFVNPNSTHSMSTGAVSNARGEFRLDSLVPGSYAAILRPEKNSDLRADQVRFEVTDQDVTGLVITIKKAGSISGVLVLEDGDDKAIREQLTRTGVSVVMANSDSERGGWGYSTRFAADGSFRIGGLPAGTATFYISSQSRFRIVRVERDGVIQPRGVDIKELENVTGIRIITSYANASIRGTIEVQNGTIPPNAQFSVSLLKPSEQPYISYSSNSSTQVDARGQFVIDGLLPGNYELNIGMYIPGANRQIGHKKQEVVVTAGTVTNVTVTLDLRPQTPQP